MDDTFDSILFPEDRLENTIVCCTRLHFLSRLSAKGFKEGYAYGSKQGFDDACAAGYARGKDIGKEVAPVIRICISVFVPRATGRVLRRFRAVVAGNDRRGIAAAQVRCI